MRNSDPSQSLPGIRVPTRWRSTIAIILGFLVVVGVATYLTRRTLLLNVARIALNHDAALVAQEHADAIAVVFAKPPPAWINPMKNRMNEIWEPIKADGVNYFMFAGPSTWLQPYSERSNPRSPYYQAWVGAYVIKRRDGSLPEDLRSWAWQVTSLDQPLDGYRRWGTLIPKQTPLRPQEQETLISTAAASRFGTVS